MGSFMDLSDFLLAEEHPFSTLTKSKTTFERFYYSLVFNDLLFMLGFMLLHFWRVSDGGESCSKDILSFRGSILMLLLDSYWFLFITFLSICCCARCFFKDRIDGT